MIWINNGCSNVYDAVQKKTGNAEKILNPRREYCVTNMRELALLLKKYAIEEDWIFKCPDTAAQKIVRRIRFIRVDCG